MPTLLDSSLLSPAVSRVSPGTGRAPFAESAILKLPDGASAAVFGAPGTGKTTLVGELVAERVLGRGWRPNEVAVISATRESASRLRDALALRLGVPTDGPMARTVNSLAFDLVCGVFGRQVTLLTGAEQDHLIADLLEAECDGGWPETLSAQVRALPGFRAELRDLIGRATELGLDGRMLAATGLRAGRQEWVAVGRFLTEYADVKDQVYPDTFDTSELLRFASQIVRTSVLSAQRDASVERLGAFESLRLIVVDDAQEATEATASLLAAFAARGVAIIAVGDPDVATNGFRGGKPDVLGSLGAIIGQPVDRFALPTVFRGRAEHRALVLAAEAHIGTALGGLHRSAAVAEPHAGAEPEMAPVLEGSHEASELPEPVVGVLAPSRAAEVRAIADELRERHLLGGVPWTNMAVVARSQGELRSLALGLAALDVPVTGHERGTAVRDRAAARALLLAAAVVLEVRELTAETATELLLGPIGRLDTVRLRRLRAALRRDETRAGGIRSGDDLLVDALRAAGGFETLDTPIAKPAAALARLLANARSLGDSAVITEVLWALWNGSRLAGEWQSAAQGRGPSADEANAALDAVVALFAAAERFVERDPGAVAARFVREQLDRALPEDVLAPVTRGDRVLLATPPVLIGRQFDVVVVSGLQDGAWPNFRPRGTLLGAADLAAAVQAHGSGTAAPTAPPHAEQRAAVLADELRLFVLAVSRARQQVVLTAVANDDEQPSRLMNFAPDAPSRSVARRPMHLRGMVGALRRDAVANPCGQSPAALALLAERGVPGAHPDDWYGLAAPSTVAPLVDLADPGARVPVSASKIEAVEASPLGWFIDKVAQPSSGQAAAIGSIVHAVVEEFAAGAGADATTLWERVASRVTSVCPDQGWVVERELSRARQMVAGAAAYLADSADEGRVLLGAEGGFTIEVGRAQLIGRIDRVEATPDGTTVIVDIKTGSTVPTEKATAEHPQLGAYQLAAREGALPTAGTLGGARLVYVAKPARGQEYSVRAQQPFDDAAATAFGARVDAAAVLMGGATFAAPGGIERGRYADWIYRVQVVPAVSA
ncbi:MAG TPA: PD-(D/E)XK nuclease family protein [Candidatus Lumbricidophila sp.]|nr:PD-(D/E)XK nuclease family protein [Candidatus Lumbricidophila sp.]